MKYINLGLLLLAVFTINTAQANVVGADTHNFNPLVNGIDFVTVKSSETLDAGYLNLGAFIDYSANSLPTYEDTNLGRTIEPDDTLLHMDLHAALGLTNWWDIGFNIANVISQETNEEAQRGFFADKGLTDIMLYTKIRFLGNDEGGAALALSANLPQTKNSPFLGLNTPAPSEDYNKDPIFNIELALDKDFGKWSAGVNAGYRVRSPGKAKSAIGLEGASTAGDEVTINPVGDQILASAALAYKMTDKTRIIGEYFTSFLAGDPEDVGGQSSGAQSNDVQDAKTYSTNELLLGLRHDLKPNIHLHAGASTALQDGTSSPDYRVYGGVNYRFGRLWGAAAAPRPEPVEEIVEEIVEEPYIEEPVIEAPIIEEPIAPPAPAAPIIADANDTNVFGNAQMQKVEIYSFRNLNFRTNSAKIPSEFRPRLSELTQYVNQTPVFQRLIVHGHTDSRGSSQYNAALSQRRADMVRRALIQVYGLPAEKLSSIGHGEDQPIADNTTPEGLLSNRRVEFEIFR